MATIKLSSPWIILYREIQAMFKHDKDVKVVMDEEAYVINVYVDDQKKYEGIKFILEQERIIGNIHVAVNIIPGNFEENDTKPEIENIEQAFKAAFEGSDVLSFVKSVISPIGHLCYVVFQPKVVQYFNDDLSDVYGNCSTLYQNIAEDIFNDDTDMRVFYCTDLAENLAKPLGEWP